MTNSIWPYDTFIEPRFPVKAPDIEPVTCFVAIPSRPERRWDDLFNLINQVCAGVGKGWSLPVKCLRAIDIASSGIIHPEIWREIRRAAIVICDVTGHNGNVILELGVAAAWRRKENVTILRDKNDDKDRLFDIIPARHIEYEISYSGLQKFASDLAAVMQEAFSNYPFQELTHRTITLPFSASLTDMGDNAALYTEDITHRRLLEDCLEFGAPLVYRHSWMCLDDLKLENVRVKAEMKLTLDGGLSDRFFGIMVRGQSFFANQGHFVLIRDDGKFYLVVREDDMGKSHDEFLGQIPNYNIREFTRFEISIDKTSIDVSVNGHQVKKNLANLPYSWHTGRIFFIAGHCRVGIRNISVEEL
jgi:hypothetical protein